MAKLAALLLVLTATVAAMAQAPVPSPVQAAEMKKLDWIVGEWQGEGWMMINGQKAPFLSDEKVQSKLDGSIIVIEGLHKAKTADKGEGRIVHNALAVISYDERAKGFRFHSYLAGGPAGDFEGKVENGTFIWLLDTPRGKIQYKIKLNEKNEWAEVGEFSPDGTTWNKIFEMTLQKKKSN